MCPNRTHWLTSGLRIMIEVPKPLRSNGKCFFNTDTNVYNQQEMNSITHHSMFFPIDRS